MVRERINKLIERLKDDKFLNNVGTGNETPFYMFTYRIEDDAVVTPAVNSTIAQNLRNSGINALTINLLAEVVELCQQLGIYEPILEMQESGASNKELLDALEGELNPTKFVHYLSAKYKFSEYQVVLIYAIGSVHPIFAASSLISNFQSQIVHVPVVFFYPGEYDQTGMMLFGKLQRENYYRAFLMNLE